MTEILHFTTARDVAPEMSGHEARFASEDAFKTACRAVWEAADGKGCIARDAADAIMDAHVEQA